MHLFIQLPGRLVERVVKPDQMSRPSNHHVATRGVVVALAAAAGLHLAALPRHLEEGAGVASFFLLTAALQLGAAAAASRGIGRRLRALIAAGNATLILLWAVSRSVGLPGSGHAGTVEPVGLLDLLAVGAEITVLVGLFAGRASTPRRPLGAAWSASAVITFLVCGTALQWAPASHGRHDHGSRPAGAETAARGSAAQSLASRSTAPDEDTSTDAGDCSGGFACHHLDRDHDHTHPQR